jgi:hypothetical protein
MENGPEAVRRLPIDDEAEDRQREGRRAQPEAKRGPDEERRAHVDQGRGESGRRGPVAEDVHRRDDERDVERQRLGQPHARELDRFLHAVAAPREDERRREHHPQHGGDEHHRPLVLEGRVRVEVGKAGVERRHGGHRQHEAHQDRAQSAHRVDLDPGVPGQALQHGGREERLRDVHRHGGRDPLEARLQVETDRDGGERDEREIDGPAAHGNHQQHAERDAVPGPDQRRELRREGQAHRIRGENVVDDAERDVGEELPHCVGIPRTGDRWRLGVHPGFDSDSTGSR